MKKILITIFATFVSLSLITTTIYASSDKGQKIIIKKLKRPCGFNGAVLAKKHTQEEWTQIFNDNNLSNELKIICPKAKPLKKSYLKHVYDFLNNYASDSGNVPSC